ncbi:MAG: hypothetical protein ACP5NZ_00500 [Nanobdellota archaeon]
MKPPAKIAIILIAVITLIVIILFNISSVYSEESFYDYNHSWTKAICNETHCQDYVIYCKDDKFIEQSPITGAVISIPEGWEDPRSEEMRERVCE